MHLGKVLFLGLLALSKEAHCQHSDNVIEVFPGDDGIGFEEEQAPETPAKTHWLPAGIFWNQVLRGHPWGHTQLIMQLEGDHHDDPHDDHHDDPHEGHETEDHRVTVEGIDTFSSILQGPGEAKQVPKADEDVSEEAACPCKSILVSSLGPALHYQTGSLGVFTYYQMFNGRPAYHNGINRLYFLSGSGWLIGTVLGGNLATIHNADMVNACPYLVVSPMWMYVWNSVWNYDNTLVVRCIA